MSNVNYNQKELEYWINMANEFIIILIKKEKMK
jgi:hypothetical protein